jgi:glycine cleavage system H protein
VSYPNDRKYATSHEWVSVDGDTATVGISNHAQDALGELVYVDLPEVDDDVTAGESCAEVESTKAVSDIYSPVSGTVSEINEALDGNEQTVNEDPHGAGWLFKVTMSDPSELDKLMDGAAYSAHADEG